MAGGGRDCAHPQITVRVFVETINISPRQAIFLRVNSNGACRLKLGEAARARELEKPMAACADPPLARARLQGERLIAPAEVNFIALERFRHEPGEPLSIEPAQPAIG